MDLSLVKFGAKEVGNFLTKNSQTILTTIAVGGVFTTGVFAVTGTIKAVRIIDAEKKRRLAVKVETGAEYVVKLTKTDVVKLTWACYIPTVIAGTITVMSIITGHTQNARRYAALAGAYTIAEKALAEYKEQVVEVVGQNKAEKIRGEIAQKQLDNNPLTESQVIITGRGDSLCFDSLSARYFYCDMETIRRVQNDINHAILSCDGFYTLNTFYGDLGLESTAMGDELGWTMDVPLDIEFASKLAHSKGIEEGKPCLVINYKSKPRNV